MGKQAKGPKCGGSTGETEEMMCLKHRGQVWEWLIIHSFILIYECQYIEGFPGGASGKEPAC